LLIKYQTKKLPIDLNENNHDDKFNFNIRTMVDTKWNSYKTSFQHSDQEEQDDNDDDEDLYSTNRQRTSSRSSGIQSKILLVQPKKV